MESHTKRWLPALGCALTAGTFATVAALTVARLPTNAAAAALHGTAATGRATAAVVAAEAAAAEATVTIDNFTFTPATLIVAAGARVVWMNRDDSPHTIVAADEPRAFRSDALDTGEQFAFAFLTPGTYRYFCSLHPHMQGTVIVH